jgi:hypothetical protein
MRTLTENKEPRAMQVLATSSDVLGELDAVSISGRIAAGDFSAVEAVKIRWVVAGRIRSENL